MKISKLNAKSVGGLSEDVMYGYTVRSARESVSKKGTPMITLCLSLDDENQSMVVDHLTGLNPDYARRFVESTGNSSIIGAFKKGSICDGDLYGLSGKLTLQISETEGFGVIVKVREYVKDIKDSKVS